MLEELATGNELGYVPLVYGYVTYCGPDFPGLGCQFADLPSGALGRAGSTLGGAGLAIPTRSERQNEALDFACFSCSAGVQRDLIAVTGGQPAHRAAWDDQALNASSRQFYAATRATIDAAWVRPRQPWWPQFQRQAGLALQQGIVDGQLPHQIVTELRLIWEEALAAWSPAQREC